MIVCLWLIIFSEVTLLHIFNYVMIIMSLFLAYMLFAIFPQLRTKPLTSHNLKVSIIVPARNEERNLPLLLQDISDQSYKNLEIICVDDCSEDGTAKIIKDSGAIYIYTSCLPNEWRGKTWACQKGSEASSGEYLLFIDADVRLGKKAIEKLVLQANPHTPVSVQPYHNVVKPYESFSIFFNFIQNAATKIFLPGKKETEGMFGPVVLINKKLFDANGGFEPVKSKVVEDYCLGQFYRSKGIKPGLFIGGKDISFRMYSEGLKQLLEGWTKNFSTGAGATTPFMLFLIVVWITGITVLPVELLIALTRGWQIASILLLAAYICISLLLMRTGRKLGSFPHLAYWAYPIPLLAFHLIFIYSLLATKVFKNTTWKGRKLY